MQWGRANANPHVHVNPVQMPTSSQSDASEQSSVALPAAVQIASRVADEILPTDMMQRIADNRKKALARRRERMAEALANGAVQVDNALG